MLAIVPDRLVRYKEEHLAKVSRIVTGYLCRTNEGIREIDRLALRDAYESDEYLLDESR